MMPAKPLFTDRPSFAAQRLPLTYLRQKFYFTNNLAVVTNYTDFDVGWWNPGTWINYTRTFPTNTYNVYGRLANSGPYSGVTLSLVTGGVGTSNQTTSLLGTFSDPNIGRPGPLDDSASRSAATPSAKQGRKRY